MNKSRHGWSGRYVSIAGAALLAGMAAEAQDNNAACTLRGRDTVLATGTTVKSCLDLDVLNNQTVVIPANVTHIDNTGFSLCETSETQGGLADIVYVMDQSGSMRLQNIWISPDGRDTIYMHGLTGCRNGYYTAQDQSQFGSVTVLRGTGVFNVNKLNPAKNPNDGGCRNYWSGDPFYQRDIALKQAIDYQAQRAPKSRAGYLGFSNGVVGATSPRELSTPQLVSQVKQNINIINDGATNYTAALDQAKKWLTNPTFSPNPTKAVIFVSDGKPDPDSTGYLNVLSPTYAAAPGVMPPVYGIFMGVPRPDTIRLSDLSKQTGGRFYLIPPDRPDSLRAVVEGILNIILKQYQPNQSTVNNGSLAPPVTAVAGPTSFTRQENNSWLINYSEKVPLNKAQPNAITTTTQMRDVNAGDLKNKTASFTLNTIGPEERTNKNLPGTQFSVVCQPLPPDINAVKLAYIKDTDGDGAGDKVFFVFTRPLLALPATIDSVYWNKVGPGFSNRLPPKLSFLPGSSNTIVVADYTASPYPKGLTSIPPGEKPVGVMPPGGVFLSQRPAINDSMGPILDSGFARPYDSRAGGGALNLDTLVIHVSEPMRTNSTWENMIRWGEPVNGQCNDYANAKTITPARQPTHNTEQTVFTFVIRNGDGGPTPTVGDCIYLNTDGTQTDIPLNVPPARGILLRGRAPARVIELFRGYPPVVGFDSAHHSGFLLVNNDPRTGELSYSRPHEQTGKPVIYWVPPADWIDGVPYNPVMPAHVKAPSVGQDIKTAVQLPKNISTIQVVSTGKYIAHVSIFDNHGRFMKKFRQAFGFRGEMDNGARQASKGQVSYLIWDLKDSKGAPAGQGVYVWKVLFSFENGKQEIQYTRTGVMRNLQDPKAPVP